MIDQNQFSKKCENIIFMHRLEREGKGRGVTDINKQNHL